MAHIGLQLYTVREVANQQGYESTIRKVADAGYRYVETAGFPGSSAADAAKLFKELGMTVVASHIGNPVGADKEQLVETMLTLGKPRWVIPSADAKKMTTVNGVRELCDTLNQGAQVARDNGMQFGYHNHWMEYGKTEDGQYVYQLMMKYLHPSVFFELDTYWIKEAGLDPVDIIKEMGKRAPLLHIKDGPGTRQAPMTAVGEGMMDWHAILKAGEGTAEYWIVEMDRVAGDPLVEVAKSYQYLKNIKI